MTEQIPDLWWSPRNGLYRSRSPRTTHFVHVLDDEAEPLTPTDSYPSLPADAVQLAPARVPRVFFPDDMVPAGTRLIAEDGAAFDYLLEERVYGFEPLVEVPGVPSGAEWQAIVDRARLEREQ